MMETKQMTKQVLDFQKGAFSSWYGAITAIQKQALSSVNLAVDQADWMPEEGRRMVLGWINACKEGGERYKAYLDESFSGIEKYLVKDIRRVPTKTKKKSAAKIKTTTAPNTKKPISAVDPVPDAKTKIEEAAVETKTTAAVSAPKPDVK